MEGEKEAYNPLSCPAAGNVKKMDKKIYLTGPTHTHTDTLGN